MIVTGSTLLGLTSLNGSFELHLAMLIILFWHVETLTLPNMPIISKDESASMENYSVRSGYLIMMTKIMHSYLFVICFCN